MTNWYKNIRLHLIYMILLAGLAQLPGADYHLSLLESQPHVLTLKVEFDEPQLRAEADGRLIAGYDGAVYTMDRYGSVIPAITKIFNLADRPQSQPRILDLQTATISYSGDYLHQDVPAEGRPELADGYIRIKDIGRYRDIHLYALQIYPVRVNRSKREIRWVKSLQIKINSASAKATSQMLRRKVPGEQYKALSGLLINDPALLFKDKSVEQTQSVNKTSAVRPNPALARAVAFKLLLDQTGIYKITYDDLADADFPLQSTDPRRLHLYNKGQEVPVYFRGEKDGRFDEGDYFEFWGERNEKTFIDKYPDQYADPFSDQNVYWLVLTETNGIRLQEESGGIGNSSKGYVFEPYAFRETLHFEEDRFHENFGHSSAKVNRPSYELDSWFYDSGISSPEGIAYEFFVPHPFESGSEVTITAAFRGKSFYSYPYNLIRGHKVELKLRGKGEKSKLIGEVRVRDGWRDQNMWIISNADSAVKLSQSALNNGINRLEVDLFQSGVTDIVLLNWFEISYLRKYRAHNDFIKFRVDSDFFNNSYITLGDTLQINVDGFSSEDIHLYKLNNSKITNGRTGTFKEENYISYGISFQDEIFDPEIEYVAVTEGQKKKPQRILPYEARKGTSFSRELLDKSNAADYLIITNDLLYENALKLRELKNNQGFNAEVVTVGKIYDAFNFGIPSPLAIKDFIRYAAYSWNQSVPLNYVVFVGDASYDYKGRYGNGADQVPTIMFQSVKFGSAASDYQYALLDDDLIPDVIVGRIPAGTNQQLLNYIDKIETYSRADDVGPWRNSALFISGNDASGGDREFITNGPIFRSQNLRLATRQMPAAIFSHRLNTVKDESIEGYDPNFGSTTDLIEYFDDGVSFINYLGHGGGAIWADVQLLNLNDVERMNNEKRLPFVASMTCFTGAFENPGRSCLAEKLVLSEKKGAIAMLASSGLGWKYNDFALEWNLFQYLWQDGRSFGEAVDLMKIFYLASPTYYSDNQEFTTFGYYSLYASMLSQYNLIGDPALQIQRPRGKIGIAVDNEQPFAGDSITISLNTGFSTGQGKIQICDDSLNVYLDAAFSVDQGRSSVRYVLPERVSQKILYIKAYATNGNEDANGYLPVSVERSFIKSIKTEPARPTINQPISFTLTVRNGMNIREMYLKNFREPSGQYYGSLISMNRIDDSTFTSAAQFPGFARFGEKYFDIEVVRDNDQRDVFYRQKIVVSDNRPDLYIVADSTKLFGADKAYLSFIVSNNSSKNLDSIEIKAAAEMKNSQLELYSSLLELSADTQRKLIVPIDFGNTLIIDRLSIIVDPQNRISERNENNNIDYLNHNYQYVLIDKASGTTSDGQNNIALDLAAGYKLFMPGQSGSSGTVVLRTNITRQNSLLKHKSQKSLRPVAFSEDEPPATIEIDMSGYSGTNGRQVRIIAPFDSSLLGDLDREYVAFYGFNKEQNLWIREGESLWQNNELMLPPDKTGLYTVFEATDHKKPFIEVSSNGRPLIADMLVTTNPSISILLQDENGINLLQSLNVKIDDQDIIRDGQVQKAQEVALPDSVGNARSVALTVQPQLESGSHQLFVEVMDVTGNKSAQEYSFIVTEGFDIIIFGNYPNPFSDQTIISYYIDSDNEIDDFSIKIYTNSGRLIRTKELLLDESISNDNIRMPFHHELIWDGTDDDGFDVANGIYFAVVSGKYKNKHVSKTLKIARLR